MLLLGFKLSCGKSVKYRYINSLPLTMIPFLFPFSRGLLFPLVALDKIARTIEKKLFEVWIH